MAKRDRAEGQLFGYARVSTRDQRLDMQIDAMQRVGVPDKNIYVEKVSGSSKRRPAFEKCLKALRRGDTLYVWRVDRLGRRALAILQRLQWFRERGITFKSIMENVDFETPLGELLAVVSAGASEFEVRSTAVRTKAGIAAHRARGGNYGRKTEFDVAAAVRHLRKHKNVSAAAKHVGVSRQTLWYHVKRDQKLMALLTRRKR